MTHIAFLGLGAMGARMAARLVQAGRSVTVHNRTKRRAASLLAAGAQWAETPRDAAAEADMIISMVRDDDASEAVWLAPEVGAVHGMTRDTMAVESSTLTPVQVRRLDAQLGTRGVRFVEAPVVGTRPHAEAGTLAFLVGGELPEEARTVLEVLGSSVHEVGPVGSAAAVKLAVNSLFASQVAAVGELLAFLDRAGVTPTRAMKVLAALPVTSPAAKAAGAGIVEERWAPLFPVELAHKDLVFMTDTARAKGASTPVSDAARSLFERAVAAGLGDENLHAVAKLFRTGQSRAS